MTEQMLVARTEEQRATTRESTDVGSLVQLAITEKVPVEILERLVALQERVTELHARQAFIEAKAKFQEMCDAIPKKKTAKITTRKGSQYQYSYAPLDDIQRHIRQPLKQCGLSYSWDVEIGENLRILKIVCVLRHIEGHEERSVFPVPIDTDASMSDAQKTGAAQTYGKRQSLVAVLGITTADQDTDAARAEAEGATEDKISDNEAADLHSLAEEVGADRVKFLALFDATAFNEIKKSQLTPARKILEAKRK